MEERGPGPEKESREKRKMKEARPPALEVLIVLGGRVGADGYPGRPTRLRLLHALNLWREHYPGAYLLLSGGRRHGAPVSEAWALRKNRRH